MEPNIESCRTLRYSVEIEHNYLVVTDFQTKRISDHLIESSLLPNVGNIYLYANYVVVILFKLEYKYMLIYVPRSRL